MPRPRVLSGVQPTGALHLGNWLGAIRNWVTCPGLHPDIPFTILFRTAFPQWVILLAAGLLALFLVLCYFFHVTK